MNYFSGGNTAEAWNWTLADKQFKNRRKYTFTTQYESQCFKHKSAQIDRPSTVVTAVLYCTVPVQFR
jgi:hypothetical protein